jgi:hypothetical protein
VIFLLQHFEVQSVMRRLSPMCTSFYFCEIDMLYRSDEVRQKAAKRLGTFVCLLVFLAFRSFFFVSFFPSLAKLLIYIFCFG